MIHKIKFYDILYILFYFVDIQHDVKFQTTDIHARYLDPMVGSNGSIVGSVSTVGVVVVVGRSDPELTELMSIIKNSEAMNAPETIIIVLFLSKKNFWYFVRSYCVQTVVSGSSNFLPS